MNDIDDISLREFFKQVITQLKGDRDDITMSMLKYSSARPEWFVTHGKNVGKYVKYTDEYIDTEPLHRIQTDILSFIADCYRQR